MRLFRSWPGLVLAAALACSSDNGPVPGDIALSGTSFSPASLVLVTKRPVVWAWQDGPHTLAFEDGAPGVATAMSSGTFTRDFTAAAGGAYRYRCTIHSVDFTSGMSGTVTVP
jgi:plastocyanin